MRIENTPQRKSGGGKKEKMVTTKLQVKGMHCKACETLIKEALEDEGATNVEVNHEKGTVNVEHDDKLDKEHIKIIIKAEGYEA